MAWKELLNATDHGSGGDPHPQYALDSDLAAYLAKTGLTEWDQQGSDPSNPGSTKWKLYFKSGGLYYKDSAGAVTGPLAAASVGDTVVKVTSDWTTSSTTPDDVTGLGFTPGANKTYRISGRIAWRLDTASILIRFLLSGPTGFTYVAENRSILAFGGPITTFSGAHLGDTLGATVNQNPTGYSINTTYLLQLEALVAYGSSPGSGNLRVQAYVSSGSAVGKIMAGSHLLYREI